MKLSEMKSTKYTKVIVFGDSGTGKTCFAAGFPGPIEVCDFDLKIGSAANFYAGNKLLDDINVESYPYDSKDYGGAGFRFNNDIDKLKAAFLKGERPCETLVLDSFTTMSERLMEHFLKENPNVPRVKIKGPIVPSQQDYGYYLNFIKKFLSELVSLPCNLVMTAHIEIKKDDKTGALLRLPMASGKISSLLPIYFEEVYMSYVEGEGDKRRYRAQTQADRKFNCRSQRGLPPVIDLSYESLVK